MLELVKYWHERDKGRMFYPISGHFKTELVFKTRRAKKIDQALCVIWKVRGMI